MLNSHIFREKIPHFIGSPLGTLDLVTGHAFILNANGASPCDVQFCSNMMQYA